MTENQWFGTHNFIKVGWLSWKKKIPYIKFCIQNGLATVFFWVMSSKSMILNGVFWCENEPNNDIKLTIIKREKM